MPMCMWAEIFGGESLSQTEHTNFSPSNASILLSYATENNFRIRCSGYRHSWGPIFGDGKGILVSFVNLNTVTTLPDPLTIAKEDVSTQALSELGSIEIVGESASGGKLVRLGVAVTGEDFRRWQLANGWAMPVNTILVEVTTGGMVSGICHGAGLKHNAIPDYVQSVEYVDCKGQLQTVNNAKFLTVAAGNYGLLGVLTHVTVALEKMTYAVMEPRKVDIGLAVPPMHKDDIPIALRKEWYKSSTAQAQLSSANKDFEGRVLNDYYCEWFWCPYQEKAWVHTWNKVDDNKDSVVYPDDALTFLQWIEGWIGGVFTSSPFFGALPGYWQAQLLAIATMAQLPPTLGESDTPTIKTALPNALHYRRGIQNMRVRNLEFQIPLPPDPTDPTKPDLSIAKKCWWEVINLVYEVANESDDPSSPMRLVLEMRFLGQSNLVLAPYHGNELGTLSIGVLTIPDAVSDGEWNAFLQKVVDRWIVIADGQNVRPHMAKEWDGLKIKGLDAREYLKEIAYKDQIKVFKEITVEIGTEQRWTVEEMKKRFSNELFDKMIFE
ncbi:hypothetical protein BDZ45DRAFT_662416 [Acephala macrosclerotiorum]|nr:hypothetical protein BDZ45DRAFT_662416 [Acephala macrosclerotiorum]